jgi:hypothetical protein
MLLKETYLFCIQDPLQVLPRKQEIVAAKLANFEKPFLYARKGPPSYPPRFKTHWDLLLEEVVRIPAQSALMLSAFETAMDGYRFSPRTTMEVLYRCSTGGDSDKGDCAPDTSQVSTGHRRRYPKITPRRRKRAQ